MKIFLKGIGFCFVFLSLWRKFSSLLKDRGGVRVGEVQGCRDSIVEPQDQPALEPSALGTLVM